MTQEVLQPTVYEAVVTWADGTQTVSPPGELVAVQSWLTHAIAEAESDRMPAVWGVRPSSQMRLL